LSDVFTSHRNQTLADGMEKYMRNLFPFYGIKKPERAAFSAPVLKILLAENTDPARVATWCWEQPEREWQYFGQEYLAKASKHWNEKTPDLIEKLVTTKSWWDTVDFISVHCAGKFFMRYPDQQKMWIEKWRYSDNFWLVRVAILFQLQYKEKTDMNLLFAICKEHAWQKEFFIRKAIGWALRQYARTNSDAVKDFVRNTDLSPLSKREALKHFD
jgi:3-methyladenine DNA glycosylase AlkD